VEDRTLNLLLSSSSSSTALLLLLRELLQTTELLRSLTVDLDLTSEFVDGWEVQKRV